MWQIGRAVFAPDGVSEAAVRRRRKKNAGPAANPNVACQDKPVFATTNRITGRRLWLFRLAAFVTAPAVFFGLLELVLRLAGFGYPTTFLLPSSHDGQKIFVQNNQFGWRFFGPEVARTPAQFSIPQAKSPTTVRIFVFGESAAFGDPQPRFGLPRMLQAMLSLRHPDVRFEVVNAAMTAINSHAILPIARDCTRAEGDIWVIYMGNNEVVGPYGAGTVFGARAPPLPLVRASLAIRCTRTGQLLDAVRQRLEKPQPGKSEWLGMEMFAGQQVRADDPRMNAVYGHFKRNLADIIRAGRHSGADIVVSTVAINLKDCAPFASAHRPGLSAEARAKWEQFWRLGIKAHESGKNREAADLFHEAAQIDDRFAELRFRQGECALALGEIQQAQQHFRAARDLDTLRFRCDSRLNDLIRQAVSQREREHILLADAESAFAGQSPDGLPGENLFYEHVHPTFEGNYLLARTVAEQVEKLLPGRIAQRAPASQPWPSVSDCARRLAWTDWSLLAAWSEIFSRLNYPPFTGQPNHEAQMRRLSALMEKLSPARQPAGISEAQRACEEALAVVSDDSELWTQLAALKRTAGDLAGAEAAARRELELVPSDSFGWAELGVTLALRQQLEDASSAFTRALQLNPQDTEARLNFLELQGMLGRREQAIRGYRLLLVARPHLVPALLSLGRLLEKMGRKAEAEDCFQKALASPDRSSATEMARFCEARGWLEAAVTNYTEAIKFNPLDVTLRVGAGHALAALGRYAEAAPYAAEALHLAPGLPESHLLQGSVLWGQGRRAEAEEQFREALRLDPERSDARLNLGIALMAQGRSADALEQFEEVLQRNPTNEAALRAVKLLRAKPGSDQAR